MAKVIISFLGTGGYSDKIKSRGEYRTAEYLIGKKKYTTQFVAEALFNHYNADNVIYIGTLKSMWEVVYDNPTFVPEKDDDNWAILAEIVEKANYESSIDEGIEIGKIFWGTVIKPIILKYGLNNDENEYNISQLFHIEDILSNGDELYIDISHGFRSLPIVLLNVLSFIINNSIKDISIKTISYGMFEVSNEMNGVSPIVNLNLIKELNLMINAAHEFAEYGNAYLFEKTLSKDISRVLKSFSDSKNLNHIYNLKSKINALKGLKFDKLNSMQKAIIPKVINDFIGRFKKSQKDSHYQFEIAKWMFDKKQFGFAAIALTESIITKVCELENIESGTEMNRNKAKGELRNNYPIYWDKWSEVNVVRKVSAHSLSNADSVVNMINKLNKAIDNFQDFIYS